MLYLREADGNKEADIYGVILPKRWVEGSCHEGNPSGIFRYDGNILNELASKLAGIIGDGAVECYAGMPTKSKLMQISIQRYTELKDAHTFLMDLYSMERLYDIVRESYKRYMKYIADLSMDSALEFRFSHKPADMVPIFTTATIECTAFLALFRLYWENLTGASKSPGQRFFLSAKERDTLDEIVEATSHDSRKQIDALVKGLCPLALHGKPIADFVTWQHKNNENDYHHLFSSSVKIETSDKIPSHLRETAKKCLHDGKPLPESLAEGIEALSSIHLKIRKALEPRTASARVSIENSMQEWKAHTGEEPSETDINNLFTIFKRNKGCELDISETNIGVAHDKYTRILEGKYRRIPGFSNLAMEVTEIYTKTYLDGQKISLIGKFPDKRKLIEELEARGATIVDISATTDIVVRASNLTPKQQEKIRKYQIMVVGYATVEELIDRSTPPARPNYLRPRSSFDSTEEHFRHVLNYYEIDAAN